MGTSRKAIDTNIKILLPHEFLHCLVNTASPYVFSSFLLGHFDGQARKAFLDHIKTLAPWKDNPVLNEDGADFTKIVPITLHGDGAQFYREDEFFVWSWSSAFGYKGNIKDPLMFKYPICIIPERCMPDHQDFELEH